MELNDHGTTDWNTYFQSMLILDIRPCFWTYYIHLHGYLQKYKFIRKTNTTSFSNFSLRIEAESARRSFLLCQRNKRIFSWSYFWTYIHSILYSSTRQLCHLSALVNIEHESKSSVVGCGIVVVAFLLPFSGSESREWLLSILACSQRWQAIGWE